MSKIDYNYDEGLNKDFEVNLKLALNIKKMKKNFQNYVFLCIGTDKMSGDSFGPIVGTKLKEEFEKYNISNINIYGTLNNNVSYINIKEKLRIIEERHQNACIICVDSALSNKENIGKIFVENGNIFLGSGLNKKKIEVHSDINIKGVVGENCKIPMYNFNALKNAHLGDVIKLADVVSNGILKTTLYNYV